MNLLNPPNSRSSCHVYSKKSANAESVAEMKNGSDVLQGADIHKKFSANAETKNGSSTIHSAIGERRNDVIAIREKMPQ